MRKLATVMMAALMVLGLATPAFADTAHPGGHDQVEHVRGWSGHDRGDWRWGDRDDWRHRCRHDWGSCDGGDWHWGSRHHH